MAATVSSVEALSTTTTRCETELKGILQRCRQSFDMCRAVVGDDHDPDTNIGNRGGGHVSTVQQNDAR